ncbi:type II toxin-antitoxin system Phd/YefM family antitoxin [Prosthecomicrobium sp. N25]|uniref:type II toxin-antitoxin system Phd/YefM family antitoxin n=1 Tax=Prosthecomicrobium sp. N25 TaxID=3129254 RepID=UPI003077CF95
MKQVNLYEAKTHLSDLVEQAAGGEEIVIAKAGKPVARLVALETRPQRKFGFMKGEIRMAEDFDAPLPDDLPDLFEGKSSE